MFPELKSTPELEESCFQELKILGYSEEHAKKLCIDMALEKLVVLKMEQYLFPEQQKA